MTNGTAGGSTSQDVFPLLVQHGSVFILVPFYGLLTQADQQFLGLLTEAAQHGSVLFCGLGF